MIEILLASLISVCQFLFFGKLFNKFIFRNSYRTLSYTENSIFGVVWISFIVLIINFFLPIDTFIGNLFLILSIILFLIFFIFEQNKKKMFFFLVITSIITFLLLVLSNINRPDAGLYHIPYVSLINENKIIFGIANIHFRFAHISILQYLSAANLNFLFSISNITVPVASLVAVYIYHIIDKCFEFLNKEMVIESFIVFLIVIYSLYSFNRYSNFGNDASAHIYLFIIFVYFLEITKLNSLNNTFFYKVSFLIIFLFTLKTFMILTFILPVLVFFLARNKYIIIKDKNSIICVILFLAWFIKNVIVSGCFIYPLKSTCLTNLKYFDLERTNESHLVSEAWSKGWSDQNSNILDFENYNKNFNWLKTWSEKHFYKIIEKFFPFIIFNFIIFSLIFINKKLSRVISVKIYKKIFIKFFIFFLIFLFFSIMWFLNFPLYRYGQSFLTLTFVLFLVLLASKLIYMQDKTFLKKLYRTFIIFGLIIFISKNFLRIFNNYDDDYYDYPWPQIYSLDKTKKNNLQKFEGIIKDEEILYFYSKGDNCMYSKSPCSNYEIKRLNFDYLGSYKLYYIN